MELRDLLKFEFFFPEKDEFRAEIGGEIAYHRDDWEQVLAGDHDGVLDLVQGVRSLPGPLGAPALPGGVPGGGRRPRGARLTALDVDEKQFLAECMALGRQYRLQHRIQSAESVSTVLFDTALRLAGNRGLLAGGGLERLEERRGFAAEIDGSSGASTGSKPWPPPAGPDWSTEVLDPRSLARSSLRWDAAYCALGGSLTVMFAAPLGDHLGLAAWLVALVGFGILAWSGIVWGMARGDQWWGPTATVAGINLLFFVLLVGVGGSHQWARRRRAGPGRRAGARHCWPCRPSR